jgi:hypothetical protein
VTQTLPLTVQIDSVHCAAIREELGYRLGKHLTNEIAEIPLHLKLLVDRLHQQEREESATNRPAARRG